MGLAIINIALKAEGKNRVQRKKEVGFRPQAF